VTAWLGFTVALWAWHAPGLYQAALRDDAIHILEHLVFLLTAGLFWWALLKPTNAGEVRYGLAVPYLFTTALQSGILGALMTFTSQPWYAYYASRVGAWGLTPLQDQQLAGLIMWLPGGLVFTALTIAYFAAWLQALERRSLRLHPAGSAHSRPD
jgi:putative membrane protein